MLSIEPVERLSRIRTSWPPSSKASVRWEPMNPAPPVMNARTRRVLPSGGDRPRLEGVHRRRDFVDLVGCQSGMEWQREYLLADARGNRAVGRAECGQRLLPRDRQRVMNQGFDAARRE